MNYWKDLFREHILARGEMYYYDGAVQDLEKTEHGYHAVVEGTTRLSCRSGGHGELRSRHRNGRLADL